ncbi:F-box/LRR-repeat protein 12-like isoform X1 [Dermacentor variabilis]|uniref:F-box/LRR-repeat protein 12-like isoform X1 n=2 Tax=Dermacentor variabilis TaxID=34621 RepID=UPI003F5BD8EF
MEIEQLPESLLLEVFLHLKFKDLCFCASVCRRWRRVARDRVLRRMIDVLAHPLSALQAWHLIRAHADANLVELRISGSAHMFFSNRRAQHTFTPKFFKHLTQRCPSLKVLHLTDAFLARNMTTTKMSVSDLPPLLTHLSLRSCFFHPAEFFRAEFGRPALHSLQLLDLADCNLVSSVELGRLEQWPSLRALSLEGCHRVNDGGLSNILPLISNLVALDIEGTDISDRGVEMILLHGLNLRFLFLGHTSCTGEVFMSVSRQLKGRRKLGLSHICLRRTLVKDEPLYWLLEMVPHLMWLAVTSRHMSADVRARVKEAVPTSCQFVQFLPFYVNASTFCRHFVSDSIQNLKLEMIPCGERTAPG